MPWWGWLIVGLGTPIILAWITFGGLAIKALYRAFRNF